MDVLNELLVFVSHSEKSKLIPDSGWILQFLFNFWAVLGMQMFMTIFKVWFVYISSFEYFWITN